MCRPLFFFFYSLSSSLFRFAIVLLRVGCCEPLVAWRRAREKEVMFFFFCYSFFFLFVYCFAFFFFFYSSLRSFIFFCLILFFRLFGSLGRFFFFFPLFLVFYRSEVSAAVQAVILNYLKTKKKNNKKKRTRGRERLVQSEWDAAEPGHQWPPEGVAGGGVCLALHFYAASHIPSFSIIHFKCFFKLKKRGG